MGPLLKGALAGLLVTIVCYLFPVLNLLAPLLGGLAGGWIAKRGFEGGLLVGALMAVGMLLPGLIIAVVLGALLDSIVSGAFEWVGEIAGSLVLGLWVVLVSHTAALGIAGAANGGLAAGRHCNSQ